VTDPTRFPVTGEPAPPRYLRFTWAQRVQHGLLILSFVALALTGLPQKYAATRWGEALIALLGDIEAVRVAHRAAAVLMMLLTIYHLADVAYGLFVRRGRLAMLPRYHDVLHFVQAVRYDLGRAPERPRMGRFTYEEKIEYWSLVWGTVLMIVTGFMLWNPIATTRLLPGQVIPTALVAHGGEALLAVLAVIVWHGYSVHLRHFNRSMWTGTLGEEEMREEHALELEEIQKGASPPPPDAAVLARRRRIFLPVAGLASLLLLFGLYLFVTFEQTAIPTLLPPR
jgi:cytochrome b subunit of formate dehydrogenase